MRFSFYVVGLLLLATGFLYFFASAPKDEYAISQEGVLHYPAARGAINYSRELLSSDADGALFKIVFDSSGSKIHALLRVPPVPLDSQQAFPGVVLLPGALVPKEGEDATLGKQLASMGFAVLTLDARGVGETGGYLPSMDEDFASFKNHKQPVQHLMVFDALRAFDALSEMNGVDSSRLFFAGESNGGRMAIIASALEPRSLGVLGVSTGGYSFPQSQDPEINRFLSSINPDTYAALIAPNKFVLIHSRNDPAIPFSSAQTTFLFANTPKLLSEVSCVKHGYCTEMNSALTNSLEFIAGSLKERTANPPFQLPI